MPRGGKEQAIFGKAVNLPLFIHFTKVKDFKVEVRRIEIPSLQQDILRVVSLITGGRPKDYSIEELGGMKRNVKRWIIELLDSYPKYRVETVEWLLAEFCEGLQTRAREENKFAILIVTKGLILLTHSKAEEGIVNIENTITVLERFLDPDNVLRFARFQKTDDITKINFFERTASDSFISFLGIPPGDVFFDEKEVRIHTEIEGLNCVFQMDWNEAINKFIDTKKFNFDDGALRGPSGAKFSVKSIYRGRREFKNSDDFLTHMYSERYNLSAYQKNYEELMNTMQRFEKMHIDKKAGVFIINQGQEQCVLPKSNPNFSILCCNERVPLDPVYANEIIEKAMRNENMKLYHACAQFISTPFTISSIELFNKLPISDSLPQIINSISTLLHDSESKSLKKILLMTAFALIANQSKPPFSSFFKDLNEYAAKNQINLNRMAAQDEITPIQYKARDWFGDKDDTQLANKILTEMSKINNNGFSLLLIGNDETAKKWDPIPASRCKPERIKLLEKIMREKGGSTECRIIRIPFNGDFILSVIQTNA